MRCITAFAYGCRDESALACFCFYGRHKFSRFPKTKFLQLFSSYGVPFSDSLDISIYYPSNFVGNSDLAIGKEMLFVVCQCSQDRCIFAQDILQSHLIDRMSIDLRLCTAVIL